MKILAVGNSAVIEFEAFKSVAQALEKFDGKITLFKQDKCLESDYFSFEFVNAKPRFFVVIDGASHFFDEFNAIWYLHPFLPRELLAYPNVEHRQFIDRQFLEMRRTLWTRYRRTKKWVNDPWNVVAAENKIHQLMTAHECGFQIPHTIVTSSPERVKLFYHEHQGKIVAKQFAASPILDHVIFTSRVTPEHLEHIEEVKYAPAIFQEEVPKSYELRITVVGNQIFPAKIHSQADEETALDWRRKPTLNDFHVKMEQTEIPQIITNRIMNFMRDMKIRYGCIDMIVDRKGNYIFLECNPNGQWYFMQLKTEFPIAQAIAKVLGT